ncbi:alpha-2-macroglobulin-like protein 1 [Dendropsophus ebraccatus]|uniref:alpha-2-macroglobulin-like protein 1 n=1 Tax=Dendropsophus ebraccatus TaxID=150705 RepID=UPI0038320234
MFRNTQRPGLIGFLLGLALLPLGHGVTDYQPDINYMLLIPAQLSYPSTERACLLLDGDCTAWDVTVTATLEVQGQNITLYNRRAISGFSCKYFKVPPPEDFSSEIGKVKIVLTGDITFEESKSVLIQRTTPGVVVQMDKPSYRPSDTVQFRIVSLDENFLCSKTKYLVVELRDPQTNRIFRWVNVKTSMCVADLSFNLTSGPILGTYTIDVENGLAYKTFVVEDPVPPRFEVTFENPSGVFYDDPTVPVKVCGRFPYGKGVKGNIYVELCRDPYMRENGICTRVGGKTDDDGCFQATVDGNDLQLRNASLVNFGVFLISTVIDDTGMLEIVNKTVPVFFSTVTLRFEDTDYFYKSGFPYYITLVAQGRYNVIPPPTDVSLEVTVENRTTNANGVTDDTGRVQFSLNTSQWTGHVKIQASVSSGAAESVSRKQYVLPYYSETKSFLKMEPINETIPCGNKVEIQVEYVISRSDLNRPRGSVIMYYMVIGKKGIMLYGQRIIILNKLGTIHGHFKIPIKFTSDFGPAPKILGFLFLKNGSVTADRLHFNVEKCFPNEASLRFSRTITSPKSELRLHIKSSAGSLCAIRAVDKSLQINNEDKELTTEKVFDMVKSSIKGGYSDVIQEGSDQRCGWSLYLREFQAVAGSFVDAFMLFQEVGLKILTNTHTLQPPPVTCKVPPPLRLPFTLNYTNILSNPSPVSNGDVVRKTFPDTWLWKLVRVGKNDRSSINVTVPDAITEFSATAFCMGDKGFALSPEASLTVSKPFFVDVALPYSMVQGETLSLNATVYNYLTQCLMVQVTLLNSTDFSVKDCQNCVKSSCVCSNQAATYNWDITVNTTGLVNLTVTAESVNSSVLCNGMTPYVPAGGRLDILQRQLLVKTRGIKKEFTENMYICLNGNIWINSFEV